MHRFLVCSALEHRVGLPVSMVRDILPLEATHALPAAPAFVRGLVTIRGEARVVLDLRRFLGLRGRVEERAGRVQEFLRRRQDHVDWVAELRASVEEGRPFRKTTDPHACAFGRWYDAFRAPDPVLALQLRAFDAPHRRIHAIGAEVVADVAAGRMAEARARVERAGEELAALVQLFDATAPKMALDGPEVAVVLEVAQRAFAVVVDEVRELAALEQDQRAEPNVAALLFGATPWVTGVAMQGAASVFLLRPELLPLG